VPTRTLQADESGAGDPYESQARETAQFVAARCGLSGKDWRFAFQSQGMSGGPWIGPTVEDTLRELAAAGDKQVVLQPIGFVCDHVEVLYDIDIAFKKYAQERGMALTRPESLNSSPEFIEALAEIVSPHLRG
jgi:ferrochelatase